MCEAFAHAKMKQLGVSVPKKYGKDFTYSQRVLETVDKYFKKSSNTVHRKGAIIDNNTRAPEGAPDVLFFYDGKDRAEKYADQWQRASLNEYIEKYAPGSKGVVNPEKGKITYQNEGGRYAVVYDYRGDYFRIEDSQLYGDRKYTDLQGQNMANVTENGKTRGRTHSEYQRDTHFANSDNEV